MRFHGYLACLVLLACGTTAQSSAEAHRGYRLAGVMSAGGSYLGFLELPEGGQVLVRLGSVVAGGTVVDFDARSLRIRFPDGIVELALEGSDKPVAAVAAAPQVVLAGDEQGHVVRRTVDTAALQAGLGRGAGGAKTPKAHAGGPPVDPQRAVMQRFAPLLDLPADATVVAVNETRVTSADAAIGTVETTLAKGMPARLNLQTPDGFKRVYLMPAGSGTPPSNPR